MGAHSTAARQYRETRRTVDAIAREISRGRHDTCQTCSRPAPPTEFERGWRAAWEIVQATLAAHGLTFVPDRSGVPTLVQISTPIYQEG